MTARERSFNLADLFEVVAAAVPDREAAVCGGRRLTFGELDGRAERLAAVLAAAGIGAGDHVGVHLHNSTEYLETMLAAFKLRAVPINVNYRYLADELRYLFRDAGLTALVHEPEYTTLVGEVRTSVPSLRFTLARGADYEAALAAADGRGLAPEVVAARSGDDRYILYTGGTTGLPKGVVWRHEDAFFGALGGGGEPPVERPEELADRARRGRRRLLPACPFIHGSAQWMAWSTLLTGGTVVIDPSPAFDPAATWRLVEAEEATYLVIVGDAFGRPLVDALDAAAGAGTPPDLGSLTALLSGGAVLSATVKDDLLERLPGCIVVDGFGASETGGQGQMIAVPGRQCSTVRFSMDETSAVLDDHLRPIVPGSGTVGLLARRGHIPLGYHNDEARSAETFPVVEGVRWAVPGDAATVEADGTITVLGRGAVSINTGGEKVYVEEVESALKSHGAVFDAVVVGMPDERWGQRVVAVVAPREGAALPAPEDLAAHVRGRLAGFKAPRDVVVVDEIVRSPTGKADYRWALSTAEAALAG